MTPLTFAMSTARRNSTQTFSNFIPRNLFWRPSCLSPTATRTTHLWMTTSFLSLNSERDFCYVYSEAYLAQTASHFNSTDLFWRPLCLTPKSTGLPTIGNTPNASSTLLYLFSSSLRRLAQRLTLNSSLY